MAGRTGDAGPRRARCRLERSTSVNSQCADTETSPLLASTSSTESSSMSSFRSSDVSVVVYILVIVFAWASWIDINGLWVEIPLLVRVLPESWNLPSYLVIIIQIANIGPLVYTLVRRLAPHCITEWPVVYVIISIGAAACILLAFLWDYTAEVLGQAQSVGLISLTMLLAIVDCTTSVVFLPYMAYFKPQYMSAFYIGEGLSGLLPGVVGLAQGVGSDPECVNKTVVLYNKTTNINSTDFIVTPVYPPERFSVEVFFGFLFAMVILSGIAFTVLHFSPYCRREKLPPVPTYIIEVKVKDNSRGDSYTSFSPTDEYREVRGQQDALDMSPASEELIEGSASENTSTSSVSSQWNLSTSEYAYLLVLTAWSSALVNGVLPSTQSYSCMPYGNIAYTLAIRLSTIANPLVCFMALFVRTRSLKVVGCLTFIGTSLGCYQLYLAAMSPHPPLKGQALGTFLVVSTQVVLTACISYVKVTCASLLNDHGQQRALLWCGVVTQLGSCLGAISSFLAVNVFTALVAEQPCH